MRRLLNTIVNLFNPSLFSILGKENFERCKLTLKHLKEMGKISHDNFFMIPDERIYALEDLLSAFGMDDDDYECADMLALPPTMAIDPNQVRWMKTSHGSFNPCTCILLVNAEDDQLAMLDYLAPNEHHFKCEEFIQFVLKKNPISDERVSALLHKERIAELPAWADTFRKNPKIFKHQAYLPLLSEFGNILIQPCDIQIEPHRGPIFVAIPSQRIINHARGKNQPKHLFVVVRLREDHISAMFTTDTVELNELHSKFDKLTLKDPRRVKLLLEKALHYVSEAERSDQRNHLAGMHINSTSNSPYHLLPYQESFSVH
jgi:hypothetical protein